MVTAYVVVTEDGGEGYAEICNSCMESKSAVDVGVVDYDRPIDDTENDCQLCGQSDSTEDDKLNEKINRVDDSVKSADELDDACRKADFGTDLSKEILSNLKNAETVECVADFDASMAEARSLIPQLKAELNKNKKEAGVEEAMDCLKDLIKELKFVE